MKREENLKTAIRVMTALIGIAAVYFVLYGRNEQASSGKVERDKKKICVVIDAGHGGGNLRKVTKGKCKEKKPSLRAQLAQDKKTVNAALPFMETEIRELAERTAEKLKKLTEEEFAGLLLLYLLFIHSNYFV